MVTCKSFAFERDNRERYSPELFLRCTEDRASRASSQALLEEKGLSQELFEAVSLDRLGFPKVWMQCIGVVQQRRHRKAGNLSLQMCNAIATGMRFKVTLLALLQLFRLGCAQARCLECFHKLASEIMGRLAD